MCWPSIADTPFRLLNGSTNLPYVGVYNLSSGKQSFHYDCVTQRRWLISRLIKFLFFFLFFSFIFFSSFFLLPAFFLLQKKPLNRKVEVIPLIKICFPNSTSSLSYYICLFTYTDTFCFSVESWLKECFLFEHVAQVSLKLAMQWMMILNFWSSCLHLMAGVTGVYHWD